MLVDKVYGFEERLSRQLRKQRKPGKPKEVEEAGKEDGDKTWQWLC